MFSIFRRVASSLAILESVVYIHAYICILIGSNAEFMAFTYSHFSNSHVIQDIFD